MFFKALCHLLCKAFPLSGSSLHVLIPMSTFIAVFTLVVCISQLYWASQTLNEFSEEKDCTRYTSAAPESEDVTGHLSDAENANGVQVNA